MDRSKIGLVLGGGGARGIAHIGVLQVLDREQIPFDFIVGTSMGGIVGVLHALGISPEQLAEQMSAMRGNSLINVTRLSARRRQRMMRNLLAGALEGKTFADLKVPVILTAVNMIQGREVILNEGPLMPAVLASSAMPAVFPPVELNGMQLADGGVIDSLATHVAYEHGADKVIAVDVYPPLEKGVSWADPISAVTGIRLPFANDSARPPGIVTTTWRAARVLLWYVHQQRLAAHPPAVLLRPNVSDYGSLDFSDLEGPLLAGKAEAECHLEEIRALLGE